MTTKYYRFGAEPFKPDKQSRLTRTQNTTSYSRTLGDALPLFFQSCGAAPHGDHICRAHPSAGNTARNEFCATVHEYLAEKCVIVITLCALLFSAYPVQTGFHVTRRYPRRGIGVIPPKPVHYAFPCSWGGGGLILSKTLHHTLGCTWGVVLTKTV